MITIVVILLLGFLLAACEPAKTDDRVGEIIDFGGYSWRILEVKDGAALLLCEDIPDANIYHLYPGDVTWETSFLRECLNGIFLKEFSAQDQARIVATTIKNPANLWYGTPGGADTTDKIFLLSLEEVDKYFGDSGDYLRMKRKSFDSNGNAIENPNGWVFSNSHDRERVAVVGYAETWWWLRSPGASGGSAATVNVAGSVNVSGRDVDTFHPEMGGVRPALWLILED